MQVLHLTLKKKWFDLIACGVKKEEYRDDKMYWRKRLLLPGEAGDTKFFNQVHFRNGYGKNAPFMRVECLGIRAGYGNPEWGATGFCFVIELGKIIQIENYSILGKKDLVIPE
jgi:hypothetical protein